jgi:hypothetical protein
MRKSAALFWCIYFPRMLRRSMRMRTSILFTLPRLSVFPARPAEID